MVNTVERPIQQLSVRPPNGSLSNKTRQIVPTVNNLFSMEGVHEMKHGQRRKEVFILIHIFFSTCHNERSSVLHPISRLLFFCASAFTALPCLHHLRTVEERETLEHKSLS